MQNQEYTISQTFFCFFEKMLAMSTSWKNFPLIGGLRKLRNPSWGGHFSGLAHILDSFWIIPKCCHHRPILGAWDETILLIIHADTWDPGVLKFELRVLKRGTQLLAPSNSVKTSWFYYQSDFTWRHFPWIETINMCHFDNHHIFYEFDKFHQKFA